ncbi:MAG: hypothetical protein IPJ66_12000 [Bacteroidetes bacterium]|nr:hypothetical protein [Bacteroidota bacterium]MBL0063930.1 hypothetical protein [Bacteroidota bacterium]MBL0136918.1 hypothetical protein [Bacteroidota bacterium]
MKKLSTFNLMFILFCIGLAVFIFLLVPHENTMNSDNSAGQQNYGMEHR